MIVELIDTNVDAQTGAIPTNTAKRTFQCTLQGQGAVSADFHIEYSNDQVVWFAEAGAPLTLSGNDTVSQFLPSVDRASGFVRVSIANLTGTEAEASVVMSAAA